MKYFVKKEEIETKEHSEIYEITEQIEKATGESGIKEGHVIVQPMHTTIGIYLNEGEERLLKDFIIHLSNSVPQIEGKYLHDNISERDCPEDEPLNGHSHIKSALYSNPSLSLILMNGKLQLGRYQKILLAEFDGPCPRKNKEKRSYMISIVGN